MNLLKNSVIILIVVVILTVGILTAKSEEPELGAELNLWKLNVDNLIPRVSTWQLATTSAPIPDAYFQDLHIRDGGETTIYSESNEKYLRFYHDEDNAYYRNEGTNAGGIYIIPAAGHNVEIGDTFGDRGFYVWGSATTTGSLYVGGDFNLTGSMTFPGQWATTSSDFWETQQWRWATSSEQYFWNTTSTWSGIEVVDGIVTSTDYLSPDMRIDDSTYSSYGDFFDLFTSAGRITGGGITINDGQTVTVAAGTGLIRILDDDISDVKFFDWTASSTMNVATGTVIYIGVDYNSGIPTTTQKLVNTWDLDTEFPLGSVTNQAGSLHDNENPWWVGDGLTNVIERFQSMGYVVRDNYVGGLKIGVTGTRNPTLTKGTLWSRMTEFDITAKDCSGADEFYAWWRDGGGGWTRGEFASSTYLVTKYDDNSGDLTDLAANRYASWWVWVDLHDDGHLMFIHPQNQYTVLASAEMEEVPVFPTAWYEHGILLGRILFQQGNNTPISIDSVFDVTFDAAQAANHGNLSGLTDDDHTQYGALAQDETVTGDWTFTNATTTGSFYITDDLKVASEFDFVNATSTGSLYITNDLTIAGTTSLQTATSTNFAITDLAGGGNQCLMIANDGSTYATTPAFSTTTRQFTFTVYDDGTWDNEAVPIWISPKDYAVEIIQVHAATMGTNPVLTYNIEERAKAGLASAGTDIYAADQDANADGEDETAFSNGSIAAGSHLVFTTDASSESGTVTLITGVVYYRE